MPPKKKPTKKKLSKKIKQKQTVKQSVKQSIVIKIGDTATKKKRTYTKRKPPAPRGSSGGGGGPTLQPSIYPSVQPISRIDPNNNAMKDQIEQFDRISKKINDDLQRISRNNLIDADRLRQTTAAVREEEGEQGSLVPSEVQQQSPDEIPVSVERVSSPPDAPTYYPPSLFNRPQTQQPSINGSSYNFDDASTISSLTVSGRETPITRQDEMSSSSYNRLMQEMTRLQQEQDMTAPIKLQQLLQQEQVMTQPIKLQEQQDISSDSSISTYEKERIKQKDILSTLQKERIKQQQKDASNLSRFRRPQEEQKPLLEESDIGTDYLSRFRRPQEEQKLLLEESDIGIDYLSRFRRPQEEQKPLLEEPDIGSDFRATGGFTTPARDITSSFQETSSFGGGGGFEEIISSPSLFMMLLPEVEEQLEGVSTTQLEEPPIEESRAAAEPTKPIFYQSAFIVDQILNGEEPSIDDLIVPMPKSYPRNTSLKEVIDSFYDDDGKIIHTQQKDKEFKLFNTRIAQLRKDAGKETDPNKKKVLLHIVNSAIKYKEEVSGRKKYSMTNR